MMPQENFQTSPVLDRPGPVEHLDMVRGLAAVAVLAWHTRNLFFVDYEAVATPGPLLAAFYFATGFGHQAVMLFFVLSGYLITGSVLRAWRAGRFSATAYAVSRLSRLWVVLLPALALGALWDGAGLASGAAVYKGTSDLIVSFDVASRLTAAAALGNAAFLQGIAVPTFGSNGPLWSLSFELWYYVLFPLGFFALAKGVPFAARLGCALAFAAVAAFIGPHITAYFTVWLFGAAVAFARPSRHGRLLAWSGALAFLAAASLSRVHALPPGLIGDAAVGLGFAWWLWGLVSLGPASTPRWYRRVAEGLANSSYTLYLVHTPILVFMHAGLLTSGRWQPDAAHLLAGAGVMALVGAYAYGVSRLTEAHTGTVRAWVMARLGPRRLEARVASETPVSSDRR